MDFDFNSPSMDDKLNKYNEFNNTEDNEGSGYITYIPIESGAVDKAAPLNLNTDLNTNMNNFSSLFYKSPTLNILSIDSKPDKTKSADAPTTPVIPVKNTFTDPISAKPDTNAPILPYKVTPPSDAAKEAYAYYVNAKGLPTHVAAGIVGNLYQESGLNPVRKENNGGNGRGIAQWDVRDRWPAFEKWAQNHGRDSSKLSTQLDYVLLEPGQEDALKRTMSSKNVTDATLAFGKYYERPKASAARWDIRQGIASQLLNSKI